MFYNPLKIFTMYVFPILLQCHAIEIVSTQMKICLFSPIFFLVFLETLLFTQSAPRLSQSLGRGDRLYVVCRLYS